MRDTSVLTNVTSILCDTYTGSTYLLDDVGHFFHFFYRIS